MKFKSKKTGRPTVIPLTDAWRLDLTRRIEGKTPDEPLFPRAWNQIMTTPMKRSSRVSNSFRNLLARAGLATKSHRKREGAVEGERAVSPYSFHCFRHTMTSLLKNTGASDAITKDLVGHESDAVSRIYTHIETRTMLTAMENATKGLHFARKPEIKAGEEEAVA